MDMVEGNAELSPDPGFDRPDVWTCGRCSVSGGALRLTGLLTPVCFAPVAEPLVPGTYRFTGEIVATNGKPVRVRAGGDPVLLPSVPGPFSIDIEAPTISEQAVRFGGVAGAVMELASCSVKRVA